MKNDDLNKVIELPIRHQLDDQDITSLFMGLCKMVKRIAKEDARVDYAKQILEIEQHYKKRIENLELIIKGLKQQIEKQKNSL